MVKTPMEEDEGSVFDILEDDNDQQYVPQRKNASGGGGGGGSGGGGGGSSIDTMARDAARATVKQKPPVLIVERQVVRETPAPQLVAVVAPQPQQHGEAVRGGAAAPTTVTTVATTSVAPVAVPVASAEEEKATSDAATRIVNIIDEPARMAHKEKEDWWQCRIGDAVSIVVRFVAMAIAVFVSLVLINPPFVQEPAQQQILDGGAANLDLQRRPASLSRVAIWSGIAGAAFLLLPPIYNIVCSRFFPDDLLAATGLKQSSRKH
jgi:hypothetical protein